MSEAATVIQVGDPVLRRPSRPLDVAEITTAETRALIETMRETMRSVKGCGLAAPQLGYSLQILVIEQRAEYLVDRDPEMLAEQENEPIPFHVLVNPTLTVEDATTVEWFEGCLSLPTVCAITPRAMAVKVEALDEEARPRTIHARGWYARILQHEVEHLQGRMYSDVMHAWSLTTLENRARFWKRARPEDVSQVLNRERR